MMGDRVSFQRLVRRAGVLTVAGLTLAACAETQLAVHTAKRVGGTADISTGSGRYKVGQPYQIAGRWYHPKEDYSYVEEGIASWYGPNFHGKATANGEVYDMNDLTAAHRTLPMPSVVRVTNLENGRALVLRVNDRGPFAKERIIDVSRRGAQLLGFEGQGTTRVRVEILAEESMAMRDALLNGGGEGRIVTASAPAPAAPVPPPEPRVTVRAPIPGGDGGAASISASPSAGASATVSAPLPGAGAATVATRLLPPPGDEPASRIATSEPQRERVIAPAPSTVRAPAPATGSQPVAAAGGDTYVQAGAFSSIANARALEADLRDFGQTHVTPVDTGGGTMYRVRLGPLSDAAARSLLDRMVSAGFGNAMVVTD
ncbi:Rare lipoprotein A precursor [Caenispirillum salinarum AK4]|uniref:Endolytic peptidoglycan transglycosylase RlpA n=1 Tax=Caenispirillum salinarum AK4 TaxID=1238182 RepID=K9GZW7_9PROT|nr:septal ring lytic transglycosylase RlpA family protein [Caenispirillum salinarum]EKV31515.1 Rare lipoprotein A precursor [Caenispirillum salinarum AK4]